jgi:ADP-heptose:LPS heptosyltransferase
MRVIVFGRDHMGDAINTTGLLRGVRALRPSAEVFLEVGPLAAQILEPQPTVDQVFVRPLREGLFGKLRQVAQIRKAKFDEAIILDDANIHVLKAKLAGIPLRYGSWRGKKYRSFYTKFAMHDYTVHELRDNGQMILELLGAKEDFRRPEVFVPDQCKKEVAEFLAPKIAILHFGASVHSREVPQPLMRQFVSEVREKGLTEYIVGSENERQIAQELGFNALPKSISPLALYELIQGAEYFIGTDSGPAQMAGAAGVPGKILYRGSRPEYTKPWGNSLTIVQLQS